MVRHRRSRQGKSDAKIYDETFIATYSGGDVGILNWPMTRRACTRRVVTAHLVTSPVRVGGLQRQWR